MDEDGSDIDRAILRALLKGIATYFVLSNSAVSSFLYFIN